MTLFSIIHNSCSKWWRLASLLALLWCIMFWQTFSKIFAFFWMVSHDARIDAPPPTNPAIMKWCIHIISHSMCKRRGGTMCWNFMCGLQLSQLQYWCWFWHEPECNKFIYFVFHFSIIWTAEIKHIKSVIGTASLDNKRWNRQICAASDKINICRQYRM